MTFSCLVIVILHGFSAFKILLILFLNYKLSLSPKPRLSPWVWPVGVIVGNMVILFLNHRYDGYRFGSIHSGLDYLVGLITFLRYRMLMPGRDRWFVATVVHKLQHYDATNSLICLRLPLEATNHRGPSVFSLNLPELNHKTPSDYRQRVKTSLPEEEYSFANFVAYCLYPPLYIAGPIITFNDFMWQVRFTS